jgi:hypothetical protein
MRLYACYTPTHLPLVSNVFLPSLPATWSRNGVALFDSEVVLKQLPQRTVTGSYGTDGFNATCMDKVDLILGAIEREREPFLYSDVDVRFYGPVVDDLMACLGDNDMACQWDGQGGMCAGFMVIRPSDRAYSLWRRVRDEMKKGPSLHDQDMLNLGIKDLLAVACVPLPTRYWTVGLAGSVWRPGRPVNPPADMLVHHANWTIGVANKLALLEAVRLVREGVTKASS